MHSSIKYILIFCIPFLIWECKKEEAKPATDFKYSYVNMVKGFTLVYNVTEIVIDDTLDKFDTTRYQLKERYDSLFYDNLGNPVWRIERFKRNDSADNWIISDVWTSQLIDHQLQRVEENQRYVNIIFPPEQGKSWNGNVYNTLDPQEYEITDVDVPANVNQFHFDITMTVTLDNRESLINKYHVYNQYASHVGLINYTNIAIDYANIIPGIPIEQRIARGTLYYQTLIDYYNE